MVRRWVIVAAIGFAVGGSGCRHFDRRPKYDREPAPLPPSGGVLREPQSATDPYIPSPSLPTTPGGSGSTSDLPPPFVPESKSNRLTDPLKPKKELLLPQGETGSTAPQAKSGEGLLGAPQVADGSRESKKVIDTADLKGYSKVKPGVSAGRVPTASGFERLKKAGFKTVAYLHAPAADVSAVRKDAEGKGLTFIAIPVVPEKLADAMKALSDTVADRSNQSLYVCDDDGVRTGSLFYLYFRTVEFANDDAARLLAAPLGLTEPPSVEQTTFWVAMRDYLATR